MTGVFAEFERAVIRERPRGTEGQRVVGFFVGFCPTFVGISPALFAFIPIGGHRQALAAIRKMIEIQ